MTPAVGDVLHRDQLADSEWVSAWFCPLRSGENVPIAAVIVGPARRLVVARCENDGRLVATHVLAATREACRMLARQGQAWRLGDHRSEAQP